MTLLTTYLVSAANTHFNDFSVMAFGAALLPTKMKPRCVSATDGSDRRFQ